MILHGPLEPDKPSHRGHLPPALLAQRERLAACLETDERLVVRIEPTDAQPKIEVICQAARPEALECIRTQLAPFPMDGPLEVTFATSMVGKAVDVGNSAVAGACYQGLLASHPNMEGAIIFGFIVGYDGKVAASSVLENETGVPELGCCIENVASKSQFAAGDCGPRLLRIPFRVR